MSLGNIIPFNPLDKKNLGASVAEAMLEQVPIALGNLQSFIGVGIYAIYYTGPFEPYHPLARRNQNGAFTAPIYVGKAVPAGARKGGGVGATGSRALYLRLKEHAESIAAADNLDLRDFYCRFLVVDDIWIPLGESLLIAKFAPVWNAVIDGFGNHDPGAGRYNGLRPKWDVLHPGRGWASKCATRKESREQIANEIVDYFRSIAFPASHHILSPSQQPLI
ncbi:restriction endonuclease [Massilia sp. KIM]|uniref:Eco29kI family restriction endonuclease n=1 Tax=Massilia sp. KIM TaxID=1955422 RepID=UPI000990133A|nr:Eco29kI family restriction endonuclease [Massilia sp. KIM]OON62467.1 restriction endonuclease [Massilia sp. KIM]